MVRRSSRWRARFRSSRSVAGQDWHVRVTLEFDGYGEIPEALAEVVLEKKD